MLLTYPHLASFTHLLISFASSLTSTLVFPPELFEIYLQNVLHTSECIKNKDLLLHHHSALSTRDAGSIPGAKTKCGVSSAHSEALSYSPVF